MNLTDRTSDPVPSNEITRRSFMKKSALTAGAVTLLGHGVGFADPSSSSPFIWLSYREKSTASDVVGRGNGATSWDALPEAYVDAWESAPGPAIDVNGMGPFEMYDVIQIQCSNGINTNQVDPGVWDISWGGPNILRKWERRSV
jgi:hypothetical protein